MVTDWWRRLVPRAIDVRLIEARVAPAGTCSLPATDTELWHDTVGSPTPPPWTRSIPPTPSARSWPDWASYGVSACHGRSNRPPRECSHRSELIVRTVTASPVTGAACL